MAKNRQAFRKKRRKRIKSIAKATVKGMKTYSGKDVDRSSLQGWTEADIAYSPSVYLLHGNEKQEEFQIGLREIGEATAVEDKGHIVPRPIFILMSKPLPDSTQNSMKIAETILKTYSPFNFIVCITFTPEKIVKGGIDFKNDKDAPAIITYILYQSIRQEGFLEHIQEGLFRQLKFRAEIENISESEYEDFLGNFQMLDALKAQAEAVFASADALTTTVN